jgi:uncharacterized membrane protein
VLNLGVLWRSRAGRIPLIDAARGIALLAMFVFHLTWDFSYFGYIDSQIVFERAFSIFGDTIGSTFLGIAGASLVLAHAPKFRARAYWRHLAVIVAAAAAVSLATYIFIPEGFIFFGILHCIALASLIALPFLFLPWWAAALAAAFAIAALSRRHSTRRCGGGRACRRSNRAPTIIARSCHGSAFCSAASPA